MSKRVSDDELLKLVHMVKAKREALPVIRSGDLSTHEPYHRAAEQLLAELVRDHGGRVSKPLGATRLLLAGVASTCTYDAAGLLSNWIAAAYRELDRRRVAA